MLVRDSYLAPTLAGIPSRASQTIRAPTKVRKRIGGFNSRHLHILFSPPRRAFTDPSLSARHGDSIVSISDLSNQLSHFGQSVGVTFSEGDTDCDGDVDLQDLATLLSNFGETLP